MARIEVVCRLAALGILLATTSVASAQEPTAKVPVHAHEPSAEKVNQAEVAKTEQKENVETDNYPTPERKIRKDWNEFDFRPLTFKYGIFGIVDLGTAAQGPVSREQLDVTHDVKARDFRFSFSGRLKFDREVTYTSGVMYDGPSNSFFVRETGIQVAIPEAWGNVFLGRQKAGISLERITMGYAVWTMERMNIGDATVPILYDGIKWLGVVPNKRANWNVAYFHNVLDSVPAKGVYIDALVARACILPLRNDERGELLHLGVGYHLGRYDQGKTQLKARPESFTAPFFIDTGTFPAQFNNLYVAEAYYRRGPRIFGAEYFFDDVHSVEANNPFFHGGGAFAMWLLTGETRPYLDVGGKLGQVVPNRSAFEGGPGAVEAVLQLSYSDLDSQGIHGGRFLRLTPQLNWYLDSMVRLEVNYGFGVLDRFGVTGITHFFQGRLKIMID